MLEGWVLFAYLLVYTSIVGLTWSLVRRLVNARRRLEG
jgi:hypothetical protein